MSLLPGESVAHWWLRTSVHDPYLAGVDAKSIAAVQERAQHLREFEMTEQLNADRDDDKLTIIRNLLNHSTPLPSAEVLQRIAGVLRAGEDTTRERRMAVGACQEYFRLSREHWSAGKQSDATTFALQGVLRGVIFFIEEGMK